MEFAEELAVPLEGELSASFARENDLKEVFYLRWGRVRFQVLWGTEVNLKVLLKVYRSEGACEQFLSDTDPCEIQWNRHQRITRDFYLRPFSSGLGHITCVKLAYIVHFRERSFASQFEYIFMDGCHWESDRHHRRAITREWATPNHYRTKELESGLLQRDVDWYNSHFESLRLVPKFTKGSPWHPFHPKPYLHDRLDAVIRRQRERPGDTQTIKVCVDCIDDTDFTNHLIYASTQGVAVQCVVDWRKMTLTNSGNYARLKRAPLELTGVLCMPDDPTIEVAPDMHTKFIIFGDEDCLLGSFNITFDRWWANWESGMVFRSRGVCRLLDNVFQSIRGGVVQRYTIDPLSHFNLLYTFGRQALPNGKYYRPHQAILSAIHRARRSIKLCLFLINELRGEYHDSVIDALIQAKQRGVDVHVLVNGHLVRHGDPGKEYTMKEELERPLLPAVPKLRRAGIPVGLTYGQNDHRVPYCPLHAKYCVVDDFLVLDGSFNWYNTSTFSHDLLVVAASSDVARSYLHEFQQVLKAFRVFY
ncbi:MAG: phosphatidylserine/phosphatidylglycerophosphate/cardiolipin synthase family protein [Pirellulaceae bacterium]|nr:phosphatidylserine/phosphatidylglycerophosphate/cardiolipin synthase family protein [Pirellulaceae bacterium]